MVSLINKIKSKKYSSISDDLIKKEINNFLKKNPKAKDKDITKNVRAKLHRIYGQYQIKKRKKRNLLLHELRKKPNSIELHKKILETNLSTKERIKYYSKIYKSIFNIAGKPRLILDIGSGINPVSYPFLEFNAKYLAIEINKDDVDFINKYFKIKKIKGKSILFPILKDTISKLPKSDVCFLFKVLDPLEEKGHKFSEILITNIKSKYLIVSFSTKTISNKKMNNPRRRWFELMLDRLKYNFKTFKTSNEIFYIIKK